MRALLLLSVAALSLSSAAFAQVQTPVVRDSANRPVQSLATVSVDTAGAYVAPGNVPSAASTNAITPVVGSLVASVTGKTSAGNLYGYSIVAGATPLWAYSFNAVAAPADGAVVAGNAAGNYQDCAPVAASARFTATYDIPERYSTGIVIVASSTACGTLTKSTTATFLKVRAQ